MLVAVAAPVAAVGGVEVGVVTDKWARYIGGEEGLAGALTKGIVYDSIVCIRSYTWI